MEKSQSSFETGLPNDVDFSEELDLHTAASLGATKTIEFVLTRHVGMVDVPNAGGWTPLMYASHYGHCKAMEVLLSKGASINAQTFDGKSPLIFATANGCTPLMIACDKGADNLVQLLLKHHADVLIRDGMGMTARDVAARKGFRKLQQFLLSHEKHAVKRLSLSRMHMSHAARTPSPSSRSLSPSLNSPMERSRSTSGPSSIEAVNHHLTVPAIHCDQEMRDPRISTLIEGHQVKARVRSLSYHEDRSSQGLKKPRSRSYSGYDPASSSDIQGNALSRHTITQALNSYASHREEHYYRNHAGTPHEVDINVDQILSELRLQEYAELFHREEVDLPVFLTLDNNDLLDLGISLLGPRRKLLTAITDLNARLSDCDKHTHCDHLQEQLHRLIISYTHLHEQLNHHKQQAKCDLETVYTHLMDLKDLLMEEKYSSDTWSTLKRMRWGKRAREGTKAEVKLQEIAEKVHDLAQGNRL